MVDGDEKTPAFSRPDVSGTTSFHAVLKRE
jgi:hypothetical protein